MPDLDIIVSQLPSAVQDNSSDLVMLTQPNAQAETGYSTVKETLENIAKKSVHGIEYETLLANFPSGKRNPTDALNVLNDFIQSQLPVNTASGSIATFTTSLELPLVAMSAEIVAQQASGTPTPSSPLPITGFDSVKIGQASDYASYFRGLLLGTYGYVYLGDLNWRMATIGNNTAFYNNTIPNIAGQSNASGYAICSAYEQRIGSAQSATDKQFVLKSSYAGSSSILIVDNDYSDAETFKTAMSGVYLIYELATPTTPTITPEQFATLCQAFGITGETKTISLGQTVYGGVLDAKNGKLTVTHTFKKVSDISWTYRTISGITGYIFLSNDITGIKAGQSPTMASCYAIKTNRNYIDGDGQVAISNNTTALDIVVKDDTYTSADDFVQNRGNESFVFELATPFDIDLTPEVISALVGTNNIFADTGDVEVSFKQGIQEYIDAKIAETQALIL